MITHKESLSYMPPSCIKLSTYSPMTSFSTQIWGDIVVFLVGGILTIVEGLNYPTDNT